MIEQMRLTARFEVGAEVLYLGQRYTILAVVCNGDEYYYYLNDGSDYPHCEHNLRRPRR